MRYFCLLLSALGLSSTALGAPTKVVVFPVVPIPGEVELQTAQEMTTAIKDEVALHDELEPVMGEPPARAVAAPDTGRRPARSNAAYQAALGQLKKGAGQAQRLRFSQAVRFLRDGIDGLTKSLDELDNYSRLIDAYLLLAVSHFRKGKQSAGTDVLEQVARLRPSLELDSAQYPPLFLTVFEEARNRALGRPRGSLRVTSAPAGATVVLNGKTMGKTPIRIDNVIPGQNHLVVRLKDNVWAQVVDVYQGSPTERHANLGGGGTDAPVSMGDAMAANRFDREVRKTARKHGQDAGGEYVLVAVMGRGQGIFAVGAFLGNVRLGKWVALDPIAPDLDMLSTSIEAHALARNIAAQVGDFQPDVDTNETLAFIAGKPIRSGKRGYGLKETQVDFAPQAVASVGLGGRGPLRASDAPRGPVTQAERQGPLTSRRPIGASNEALPPEPQLEALPPEQPASTTRVGGRGPLLSASSSVEEDEDEIEAGPAETTGAELADRTAVAALGTDVGSTGPLAPDLEAEAEVGETPLWEEWWFWGAIGVGAAAIGVGIWALARNPEPDSVHVYAVW